MLCKLTEHFHTHCLTSSSQLFPLTAAITNLVLQRRKLTWRTTATCLLSHGNSQWQSRVCTLGSPTVHLYLMLPDRDELKRCRSRYPGLEVKSFPSSFCIDKLGSKNAWVLHSCICSSHSRVIFFQHNRIVPHPCLSLPWHSPSPGSARPGMTWLCLLSSLTAVTHSRTLCSSPTGLLSRNTPISFLPPGSLSAVPQLGTHACTCICIHTLTHTYLCSRPFLVADAFREAVPKESSGTGYLGSLGFPVL